MTVCSRTGTTTRASPAWETASRTSEGRPREFLEALRDLAAERFPPSVDDHLSPIMRVRSALLRAGDFDSIEALGTAERGMRLEYRLAPADRGLGFRVTATLAYRDGSPVTVERHGDRWFWRPPIALHAAVPREALDFTDGLRRTKLDVIARRRSTGERIALPGKTDLIGAEPDGTSRIGATRTVRFRPEAMTNARALRPGTWRLRLQLRTCGWHVRSGRIRVRPGRDRRRLARAATGRRGRISLAVSETGDVTLRVAGGGRTLRAYAPALRVRRALRRTVVYIRGLVPRR